MSAFSRGLRNVYRDKPRALLVLFILGLSVGSFLTMAQASANVKGHMNNLQTEFTTIVEIRPAGQMGHIDMKGQDRFLTEDMQGRLDGIPHITEIEKYLVVMLYGSYYLVGVEPGDTLRYACRGLYPGAAIIAGRGLEEGDGGSNVALLGAKGSAKGYGITPETLGNSPKITIKDQEFDVIGIFSSRSFFGGSHIFAPYDAVQRLYGVENKISTIFVKVDSVENVAQVERDVKAVLGDGADVVSQKEKAAKIGKSLDRIKASTDLKAAMAVLFGALVTLFTMILATRKRTKEIGVLKAIGASNGDVIKQFVVESLALASMGGALGLLVFTILGPTLASILLGIPADNALISTEFAYAPSPVTVGYALGAVFFFGIIGSLYPVMQAVKMTPAEGIHHE